MILELLELSQVLQAVERTGTEVRYYDKECDNESVSGFYHYSTNVDRLVVCPRNQRNHSDLFDTVRHEAIHVVQACKGGAVLPYDYYIKNASSGVKSTVFDNYPKEHHHFELEAFHAAHHLNENNVIELINKFCFE